MPFTLTREHLDSVMSPSKAGDMGPFLAAIDPEVEWRIGASDQPGKGHTGVYNLASWKAKVAPKLFGLFGGNPTALKHTHEIVEIIGNKAIIEDVATGHMRNGEELTTRNCMVFEFSAESGKIVKIRAYTDTGVMADAKRANGIPVEDD